MHLLTITLLLSVEALAKYFVVLMFGRIGRNLFGGRMWYLNFHTVKFSASPWKAWCFCSHSSCVHSLYENIQRIMYETKVMKQNKTKMLLNCWNNASNCSSCDHWYLSWQRLQHKHNLKWQHLQNIFKIYSLQHFEIL